MLIDGVFAGGGAKAFAFIGTLEAMEKKNFQFSRIAGTSAGAIMGSLIASGYTSKEIKKMFEDVELDMFLDPTAWARTFPHLLKWVGVYWGLGLYKGNKLEEWLSEKLEAKGVRTFADLPDHSLRLVAADITRKRMLVLPDDLSNYGLIPDSFPVARAVRMSCSLPFFFQPVKLFDKNGSSSLIVDGGILSNFPMWLFRRHRSKRPLLGFQLNPEPHEGEYKHINNALELYGSIFETMQKSHDSRFVDAGHGDNVVFIPVEKVKTTSFSLSDADRTELIELGFHTTMDFLKTWSR
ncbi:patatin-like phospholipase family protein [Geomicrobium sp. JCM 19039]|uniref:patatin-like phospholipase family protein n=1 Tax=Geomicrobium sp. JCM 19039 TaxID=1460636 RepID=UPI00045F2232|nr:patatin-like phospholipase family protein [Geomicrobium sp. JCM 19039]GAK12785.1 lysophospholipase-like family protein [Geomicrobium sp. JCM 19039]